MIKYALHCERSHSFESWFPSSASYDAQARRGLVECPVCGSVKVEKQIMAPAVRLAKAVAPADSFAPEVNKPEVNQPEAVPEPVAAVLDSEPMQKLRSMMRELREHVQANTEDVGSQFADEARKIHYGEAEERGIRGQATRDEAEALAEEGIGFLPLPVLPEERN